MSISIRLAKFGKKQAHSFRIVVANTRSKRNGEFLEVLGYYNPSENPIKFDCNKEKFEEWKSKGALVTESVALIMAGKYQPKAFDPQKKLAAAKAKAEEAAKKTE